MTERQIVTKRSSARRPALPATFRLCIAGIAGFTLLAVLLLVIAHVAAPTFTAAVGLAIGVAIGGLVSVALDCWRG